MILSAGDLVTIKKPLSDRFNWLDEHTKTSIAGGMGQVVYVTLASPERTNKDSWVSYYMIKVKDKVMAFLDSEIEAAFTQ